MSMLLSLRVLQLCGGSHCLSVPCDHWQLWGMVCIGASMHEYAKTIYCLTFQLVLACVTPKASMVGSPVGCRVILHRRTALHRALRLIRDYCPKREEDRRAVHNRLRHSWRRSASAALLRELREFFGLPMPPRRQCPVAPQRLIREEPVVLSSDTSLDDKQPEQAPVPEAVDLVDLAESFDKLPGLNPPLQHYIKQASLREAYIILERFDDPLLQPAQPARPLMPPLE